MRFDPQVAIKIRDAYAARHEPEAERVLGGIYWALLVSLLVCIVIGSIAFGIWEFTRPLEDTAETSVSVGSKKGLSRGDIQKTLEAFDARATRYENKRIAPIGVKDPS